MDRVVFICTIVEGDDVWVRAELCVQDAFAFDAFAHLGHFAIFVLEGFDGDETLEAHIFGEIHVAHAAGAEALLNAIATLQDFFVVAHGSRCSLRACHTTPMVVTTL